MKTMICLILDRSGSMAGRESDVIGGVNSFIDEQKKLPDPATIAFVRFDSDAIERFRPMAALAECAHLTAADFQPRGSTPLLDAVGRTIAALEDDWKKDQPERAIVVVITDGHENHSHEYKKEQIKQMIQSRQDSGKWAFIYMGANVDAFAEAGGMGFAAANTAGYQNTHRGIKTAYAAMSESALSMRATGQTLSHNLGGDIAEDGLVNRRATGAPQQAATAPWTVPAVADTWVPPQP